MLKPTLTIVVLLWVTTPVMAQVPPGFLDATLFGFDPVDATNALQSAISTGQNVYVPNMGTDWNVGPITLTHNDQTVLFAPGVVIVAKEGEFLGTDDNLFRNTTRQNVRLEGYGATLRMRQQDYRGPPYIPSEFRFAIGLYSANNMEIVGLTIENAGGDGIYVGNTSGDFTQDLLVKDVVINNAYRNGISVIAAKNVVIDNVVIANTSGTAPEAGIDFEPNTDLEGIENVVIRNSIIVGNFAQGIIWSMRDTDLLPPVTGSMENITIIGNGQAGLEMVEGALPGWTVKDSLIVDNFGVGFDVGRDCNSQLFDCTPVFEIEHSALGGNLGGAVAGEARLGTGSITNQEPHFVAEFVSTDLNHPYFMYLEPDTHAAITTGASDGSYMGARPVLWTGDMNGDELVTSADVPLYVEAMNDRAAYDAHRFTTPTGELIDAAVNGDLNRDGQFDAVDNGEWGNLLDPNFTWTGDGDWADPTNWLPQDTPQLYWDATLDNDFTTDVVTAIVNADSTVNSIDLLGTVGPMLLEVAEGVTLDVTNGMTVGPGAVLKGKGTIVGEIINSGGTVTAGMPEPGSGLLLLFGVGGMVLLRRSPSRSLRFLT
jgi:hypothetical protein